MGSEATRNAPVATSNAGTRSRTEPARLRDLLIWSALGLLFVGELAHSLWDWHKTNQGAFGPAAVHLTVFLAFFWVSAFVVASSYSAFVSWLEFKINRLAGLFFRLLAVFLVCAAWNVIATSLVMSFSLGCFLNLSLLRFAINNMQHGFIEHLVGSQRWTLALLAAFLFVSTIVVAVISFKNVTRLRPFADPRSRRVCLYVWLLLSVAFTWSVVTLNRGQEKTFRNRMMSHISFKLDPLLNFSLNCVDFYRQSRYENMLLDEGKLVPLSTKISQPATLQDRPNIIFLQIESFRGDLIGQVRQGIEVVPNLNQLARSGTCFTKGYAAASHTSLSNPSIPSSLYPLRSDLLGRYKLSDPWPKVLIYDVLKPYGYATAYIASDIESWCGMDDFLITPSLDVFVDSSSRKRQEIRLDPKQMQGDTVHVTLVPDNITMDTSIEWIGSQISQKKPFYITISLSDSHFPYKSSDPNAQWFQPSGMPDGASFAGYPVALKEQVRNTYLNAIHGVDIQVGRLLEFLRGRGVDDHTIIVVYGDHGESFYENNFPTHANLPYDPSVRTCLIMNGQGYFPIRKDDYPASLIDAVPTVLARLGLRHPNFQGIDVLSSNRPPTAQRCLYMHVDGIVNADGLLAAAHWKYFEDNGKGDTYLYDLANDPGEQTNLAEAHADLAAFLSAQLGTWRAAQLTYYRASRYYTKFYPPTPPMLKDGMLR